MNVKPIFRFAKVLATALLLAASPSGVTDPSPITYASADIISPADGEGLRANSGDFVVLTQVEPAVRQGHRLRLLLDGTARGAAQASSIFQLAGIERGEHQLQLHIVDEDGELIFAGKPSTFHLLRHSKLHPRPAGHP